MGTGLARRVKVTLVLMSLVTVVAGLHAAPAVPSGFVYAQGNHLMLDGNPWRAIGVNFWDMDAIRINANDDGGCYYQHPDLDTYFDASFKAISENLHATAVRTFGFTQFYTEGGLFWDSTDKMVHYAQKYNVRLIPVFGYQYSVCGENKKSPSWYHCPIPAAVAASFPNDVTYCNAHGNVPAYKTAGETGPYDVSFRQYVVNAVSRYKNNPTIAFWQIMNEANALGPASSHDDAALIDFSKDIVSAIHNDAGDTNHLVNLGTFGGVGVPRPGYGQLLACNDGSVPSGGGCGDLAEAHDYSTYVPMTGTPMPYSNVNAGFNFLGTAAPCSPSAGLNQGNTTVWVDGWQSAQIIVNQPPAPIVRQPNPLMPALSSGIPSCATSWRIRISIPPLSAITVLIDDARVTARAQVQPYTFETGTDGFTTTDPHVLSLTQTTERSHSGLGALRVDLQNTATTAADAFINAPPFPSNLGLNSSSEIQAWTSTNFTSPIPDGPPLIDTSSADLHDAVVRYGKPFFLGEVGIPAHVPFENPLFEVPSGCDPTTGSCNINSLVIGCAGPATNPQIGTRAERARSYDQMMAFQLDAWHQSSGWIAWDWKDPTQLAISSAGVPQVDQMINCYSIEPGDPSTLILQKYADQTPNSPALPTPAPVAFGSTNLMVARRFTSAVHATTLTVPVRMVRGGNPYNGVTVTASGGCAGSAVTDAQGYAVMTCTVAATAGSYTITLAPTPATCSFADCAGVSRSFALTVT
jgi:hypothetical protein